MGPRVLIIGTGQAGLQTAISLRQGGFGGEILMAGSEAHLPYQRPPLSKQVLQGAWPPERCQLRKPRFFEEHEIKVLPGKTAAGVDSDACRVSFTDGDVIDYDWLALCTGSSLRRLQLPGSELPGVHYLKSREDALSLHDALAQGRRIAVIGGGYIGLEVAASARKLGCAVTVVEMLDRLMRRSARPEIAEFLERRHRDEGVTFHLGTGITGFTGSDRIEGVTLEGGDTFAADLVLVGIGVVPNVQWLEGSGIACGRGVLVDPRCRTSVETVFAAGDVAEQRSPRYAGGAILESVQNAVGQGRVVADNILGNEREYDETPWFWSEQYDCKLQMAGLPSDDEDFVIRGSIAASSFSLFGLAEGRVSSVQCINAPMEFMVSRQLITSGAEVDATRLADTETNLKELL